MGAGTSSSQSTTAPLTAAERQDLYYGSVGDILNTYNSSGLPTNGQGSMSGGSSAPSTWPVGYNSSDSPSSWLNGPGTTQGTNLQNASSTISGNQSAPYNATGSFSSGGHVNGPSLTNPFLTASSPDVSMPTGSPSPGGINFPMYQAPKFETVGNSDPALYNNILAGYTAPLDAAKRTDTTNFNNEAAKRGIWSSGLVEQGVDDINERYAPQYTAAGGAATSALSNELQNQNTFNQSTAQNNFSAGWAPLNYLSSLYAGTAGQVGGTNTFGANVSV